MKSDRKFLILGLAMSLLSASLPSWAEDAAPPAMPNTSPEMAILDSPEKAARLATDVAETAEELKQQGAEQVVMYWHVEGQKQSPYLQEMLIKLRKLGVPVVGRQIKPEDLEAEVEAVKDFMIPTRDASGTQPTLKERFQELRGLLFGTPFGITFIQHYLKKDAAGKWQRAGTHEKTLKKAGLINGAAGIGWLYVAMVVAPHFLRGTPESLMPQPALMAAAGALFGWVYFFFNYAVETARFKTQAQKIEFGEDSVKFRNSRRFYLLSTLGQGVVLNFGLLSIMLGPSTVFTGPVAGNALFNAFLSAFAFSPMEKWYSEQRLKAASLREEAKRTTDEALQNELLAKAEQVGQRATKMFNLYTIVLYPVIKNSHLLIAPLLPDGWGKIVAVAPLIAVGLYGFGMDLRANLSAWKEFRGFFQPESKDSEAQGRLMLIPSDDLCEKMAFL